jgi:hypothetical protein
MATWGEVFAIALRDAGVAAQGQTPNPQMSADAKFRANMMLNQWKRKRWLVYHLIDVSCPMDGSEFYTLGDGQTLDTPRTDQIDAAYARQVNPAAQPNQPDFPLRLIKAREDYSKITLKELHAGPPNSLFYDSDYPVAKVYPWPLASDQYELHVVVKGDLANVGNLTDDIILPPEYEEPIYANTVCRARAAFRLPPDPSFVALAKVGMQTLRSANFQVANLEMPRAVQNIRGGGYNIVSDTVGPYR